jgi:hypothetical protein
MPLEWSFTPPPGWIDVRQVSHRAHLNLRTSVKQSPSG